ncbi:MAG TPA: hypothetical protein VGM06_08810 [Polyangiaceae bacterium]
MGLLLFAGAGCKRRHVPVAAVPELGYPACPMGDGGVDDPGAEVASGHLRSGPVSNEKNVVERFDLRRTACGYTFRSRQEWPLAISDVEVRYDPELAPIWVWKRMTIAGSPREDGSADIRRYELRTGDVFIKRHSPDKPLVLEHLLAGGRMAIPPGARVAAVVGPGRGIITPWLERSHLAVGDKRHDLVLDFRDLVETLEMAALERNPDLFEASLGRTVRVYTFFGKETVFADEHDVVIGDLSGLRPSDSLSTPEPEPLPTFGGADPIHTP